MAKDRCDRCNKIVEELWQHKPYLPGNNSFYCEKCYKEIYKDEEDEE